jgi:hypothetical protein
LTLKVPVNCPFSAMQFSRWYLLEYVKDILLPAPLTAKPGPCAGTIFQLLPLVGILFGELLEERLCAVGRGPLRRG